MKQNEIEHIEINLLLDAMVHRYGYDFRSYARASVERRIKNFLTTTPYEKISEMIPIILHDEAAFSSLAQSFSVTVTEMFRDPFFYRALREKVIPVLKTWPYIKVWHAGCATGEEVYSMAILLSEEDLLARATIYATDFNDASLATAKEGIYELERIKAFSKSYQEAGGKHAFSDYYHAKYDSAVMNGALKKRITFANHNLAADQAFGEMHLILCRNVLIYFNRELQNRALHIFFESLVNGGYLCLGTREDIHFSAVATLFQEVNGRAKIFKRTPLK